MTEENKVALSDTDWADLLPEATHTIGKTTLKIRPLNLTEVALVLKMVDDSKEVLVGLEITLENYTDPLHLIAIARLCVDKLPEVMSDCSGLEEADVKRLPIGEAVRLVRALIKVNDDSKDGLVKNLEALTVELMAMMTEKKAPGDTSGARGTSSNSLSEKVITGQK